MGAPYAIFVLRVARTQSLAPHDVIRRIDPSTRATALAGGASLGMSPQTCRGVVLSERSKSKDDGSGAPGLPGGLHCGSLPSFMPADSTARNRAFRFGAAVLALAVFASGCYGPFNLTRRLYRWNAQAGHDPWEREFIFLLLTWVPIYGIAITADTIAFNSMQFWTGKNPVDPPDRT